MGLDPLSAIAPARVKALIIPLGRIRQSRFASFISRLQQQNIVQLGDVSPDGRPHRSNNPLVASKPNSILTVQNNSHVLSACFSCGIGPL